MKYLIVVDSDGTLKKSDGTISIRTQNIIKKLVSEGHYVVICTARPRYHTKKVSEEAMASKYLISSNGTEIYDSNKDIIINTIYLSTYDCLSVYEYAKKEDIRIIFVVDDIEYTTQFTRNDNQKILPEDINKFLNENMVKQCMINGKDHEKIYKFKDYVINNLNVNIVNSSNSNKEEIWFCIVDRNASKGNALITLAKYLNIPMSNTIALGNDLNDISMFEVAGQSVAVNNANEEAKSYASIITEDNDSDGVAIFLEKLIITE